MDWPSWLVGVMVGVFVLRAWQGLFSRRGKPHVMEMSLAAVTDTGVTYADPEWVGRSVGRDQWQAELPCGPGAQLLIGTPNETVTVYLGDE